MQPEGVKEYKTLIVGLGKTGLSCARYLSAQGVPVAITDTRERPPGLDALKSELPDLALFLGGFDAAVFDAAERLVVSPGVPVSEPLIQMAMECGVPVVGDIELFAQVVDAPVVAITGSNGKSTVTTLVGAMAEQAGIRTQIGGNLGEPALDLLGQDADLYVLELSSFQLETTRSLHTKAAVVLNISSDHMDRYPGVDAYARVKSDIYSQAEISVFNLDDPRVVAMRNGRENELFYTLGASGENCFGVCLIDGVEWICYEQRTLMPVAELLMPGRHNLSNALAALALGSAMGLPDSAMLDTLKQFRGLPHRTQFVVEYAGVRWYNDSKGTNVGACIAALQGFDGAGKTVLIAGGDAKGADFSALAPVVQQMARAVVLIGKDAPVIEQALAGTIVVLHASSMEDAVAIAAAQASAGDRVLLSPACASFDMFSGYEQRGQVFMDAVAELLQ
ncbi:MAG: UDP-N-acetylmuramoyl-L-alanine--D-glutamate ligase [Gammaproteobacteria bacterium]|nr:UDP-N-acetylmuramoyl-L-alanine--D-glutamate ligase [Gammaproteobacteria bacterium]